MRIAISSLGSSTFTVWKRRVSAASFSTNFLYSAQVVAAIVRRLPRASAGLSRLAASPVPAAPPAPISVCASSMNRMIGVGEAWISAITDFSRSSNSPFIEAPACSRPTSSARRLTSLQRRRHVALDQAQREALDHRRLADAGLADQDRVVLAAAQQDVDQLSDLLVAAEDRVDLPGPRLLGQVLGEAVQRLGLAHRRRRQLAGSTGAGLRHGCVPSSPSGEPCDDLRRGRGPAAPASSLRNCSEMAISRRVSSLSSSRPRTRWPVRIRAGPEHQAGDDPAALDGAVDMLGEVEHRRAALADPLERAAHVGGESGVVDAERADDPVQVGIRLHQDLVQPVRQLDIGIAARAGELERALQRPERYRLQLGVDGLAADPEHSSFLPQAAARTGVSTRSCGHRGVRPGRQPGRPAEARRSRRAEAAGPRAAPATSARSHSIGSPTSSRISARQALQPFATGQQRRRSAGRAARAGGGSGAGAGSCAMPTTASTPSCALATPSRLRSRSGRSSQPPTNSSSTAGTPSRSSHQGLDPLAQADSGSRSGRHGAA